MKSNFSDHVFIGGDFDLEIEVGETSDSRTRNARSKLWEHCSLVGCYIESDNKDRKIDWHAHIEPGNCPLDLRLYGVATTPNGTEIPCYSLVLRYGDGIDRLSLSIPFGALELAYGTDVYLDNPSHTEIVAVQRWLFPVSEWFADIGKFVFSAIKYKYALIGHESDVQTAGQEICSEISFTLLHRRIPSDRWHGYLIPDGDRLVWYPPNSPRLP